jgi:hypothetical protein
MLGYPARKWPVKQAGDTLIYTDRPNRRQMLAYDDKVEWLTDWSLILDRLVELHGEDAATAIYPCGKIQFDAEKNPLSI